MNKSIYYLTLEETTEGHASYTHVHEIIKGLERRGWQVRLFEPSYKVVPKIHNRLLQYASIQARLILSMYRDRRILYVRGHFGAFPSAFFAKCMGIPVVHEVNGTFQYLFVAWPWTRRYSRLFNWLTRMQLKYAKTVIAVTPELKEWVKTEVGSQMVEVIPNGANAELFTPHAVCSLDLPPKYAVFCGALTRWQGLDVMLKAINDPEWPTDLHLVVAGDGVLREQVERTVHQNKKLQYLGLLPYKSIPGLMARSMMGLSPQTSPSGRSKAGLFPIKLFEMLACGVPVIVTDFPGQADFVGEYRCGLVITSDDSHALAVAVSKLYSSCERGVMGWRGRQAVVNAHSWDNRVDTTEAVLERLWWQSMQRGIDT